jgi:hypothetical protein
VQRAPRFTMKNLKTEKRTQRTHCRRGHELTPENTYVWSGKPGSRKCKTCQREANRRQREGRA